MRMFHKQLIRISMITFTSDIRSLNTIILRFNSSSDKEFNNSPSRDEVSSAHDISNLRLIKFAIPKNETPNEREYRIQRIQLQEWNQKFWQINNESFKKEKAKFIKRSSLNIEEKSMTSHEELSLFYKQFLDSNREKHINYNLEWYKRHVKLLLPAFRAFVSRMKRQFLT